MPEHVRPSGHDWDDDHHAHNHPETVAPDLAPLSALGSGRHRSGATRTQRPVYVDLLPPCNAACPAGENIQAWLQLAKKGEHEAAWRELTRNNPFPAIHGRVCYHPCETSCNRGLLDGSVSIHAVERFLGDLAIDRDWEFERPEQQSGKRVLVVGAGPSGLSAAYHLTRLGHEVTVRDNSPLAGGMMRYGIPSYRLPRRVLDAEIRRLDAMGVHFEQDHTVTDLQAEMTEGGFDAAFVAVGAHLSKRVDIPNQDASRVLDAVSFLRGVESGDQAELHGTVAVYGGGNTAMDAARVARRLGADDTIIVYRRTREQMPAHEEEARDAEEEGIRINWLRTISSMGDHDLTVEVQELDENGKPHGTGRFERLEADTVILALGQESDTRFLSHVPGIEFEWDVVQVDPVTLMTGAPGVFAGGDAVPSERTVTIGVGHGKKAARSIDAWLRGAAFTPATKHPIGDLDQLHLWYFGDHGQRQQAALDPQQRTAGFDEVVAGLTPHEAEFEAGRCLSCGNCFECDGCLGSCPEDAVVKLGVGHRYVFDYGHCTGCGSCARQCPVHAIEMVGERASDPAHTADIPIPEGLEDPRLEHAHPQVEGGSR